MKVLLILLLSIIITIPPALGLLSEEGTGLTRTFIVQTGGYDFPLKVTGNLDVIDIVAMVNMIIVLAYDSIADMNSDGIVNVLDIIILINIILDN